MNQTRQKKGKLILLEEMKKGGWREGVGLPFLILKLLQCV